MFRPLALSRSVYALSNRSAHRSPSYTRPAQHKIAPACNRVPEERRANKQDTSKTPLNIRQGQDQNEIPHPHPTLKMFAKFLTGSRNSCRPTRSGRALRLRPPPHTDSPFQLIPQRSCPNFLRKIVLTVRATSDQSPNSSLDPGAVGMKTPATEAAAAAVAEAAKRKPGKSIAAVRREKPIFLIG